MSSRPGHDPFSLSDQRIENYFHLVGLVLLLWDHLLTFSMEFEHVWMPSHSMSTFLFFFNRYYPLLANIAITISLFDPALSPMSCGGLHIFREISLVLSEVIVSVLLTLRIYAIYGCNKRVLGFMVLVAAILIGLALFALFFVPSSSSTTAVSLTPLGCHTNLDYLPYAAQEAAAWEALFVYDSLLFAMIIIKGYKNKRSMERMPLLHMILRDGAIYFAVMALANLANIFTFYFAGPYTRGGLSTFSSATSVTMISRLTLNLRANTKVQGNLQTLDNVYFSTLHFEPGQGEGHPSTFHEQSVSSQAPNVHCAGIHLEGMRFEHSQIERTVFHQPMMDEDPAMKIAP